MALIKVGIFGEAAKSEVDLVLKARILDRLAKKYDYQETIPNPPGGPIPNPVSKSKHIAKKIVEGILKDARAKDIEVVFKQKATEAQTDATVFDNIAIVDDVA